MIKTILFLLLVLPVSAETVITKSHCDEMLEVLRESTDYIKEQDAREFYERCLATL